MTRREQFLALLALTEEEHERVLAAYMFAKYGHERQMRDCGVVRYFEHPRAVAAIIINELGINNDWRIIVTALLHDILEDSWILDEKRISINFGKRVARWIVSLTKTDGVDYHDRFNRCTIWQVLLIKLSDRLDNVRSLTTCSQEKQVRYVKETETHYLPLIKKLVSLLPKEDRWRAEYLQSQMESSLQKVKSSLKTP